MYYIPVLLIEPYLSMLATFPGNSVFLFTVERTGDTQASEAVPLLQWNKIPWNGMFHYLAIHCEILTQGNQRLPQNKQRCPLYPPTTHRYFLSSGKRKKNKNYWISLTFRNEKIIPQNRMQNTNVNSRKPGEIMIGCKVKTVQILEMQTVLSNERHVG